MLNIIVDEYQGLSLPDALVYDFAKDIVESYCIRNVASTSTFVIGSDLIVTAIRAAMKDLKADVSTATFCNISTMHDVDTLDKDYCPKNFNFIKDTHMQLLMKLI